MKAAVYERYGPADVVAIREIERPEPKADEVLVEVHATSVTTADWRVRASAFPKGMWLMGRLVMGVLAPRNKVLGMEFSGRIAGAGEAVRDFMQGDAVYGMRAGFGAHAEYLVMRQDGAIGPKPASLSDSQAASVPFGAICALVFLRDFGQVKPGQSVLVCGASGGVGVHAVQIAKYLGAEVTGMCSAANHELVASLGADHLIDYRAQDYSAGGERFDLIFDTASATGFGQAKKALKPGGVYLPLEFGIADAFRALAAKLAGGKKMLLRISGDTRQELDTLSALIERGQLRPVIDSEYPLDKIADAYRRVEGRHKRGSVVLTVKPVTQ